MTPVHPPVSRLRKEGHGQCSGADRSPTGLRNNLKAQEGNMHLVLSTSFPLWHPTVLTTTIINLSLCGYRAKLLNAPPAESFSSVGMWVVCGPSKTPRVVCWNEWVVSRFLWVESATENTWISYHSIALS